MSSPEPAVRIDVVGRFRSAPASDAMTTSFGTARWTAASGRQVDHAMFSLVGCPATTSAVYILVRHQPDDSRLVLAVRRTRSRHPSLNLARIRHLGAILGANEVHLSEPLANEAELTETTEDLARALLP